MDQNACHLFSRLELLGKKDSQKYKHLYKEESIRTFDQVMSNCSVLFKSIYIRRISGS